MLLVRGSNHLRHTLKPGRRSLWRCDKPISCLECVKCMLEQRECRGESDPVSESHTNRPPQAHHKVLLPDRTFIQSTNNCWLLGKVTQPWKAGSCWPLDLRPSENHTLINISPTRQSNLNKCGVLFRAAHFTLNSETWTLVGVSTCCFHHEGTHTHTTWRQPPTWYESPLSQKTLSSSRIRN